MNEVYSIKLFKEHLFYCTLDLSTSEVIVFECCKEKNDIEKIIKHLKHVKWQIGYNNIRYDSQIINFLLSSYNVIKELNGNMISKVIYDNTKGVLDGDVAREYAKIQQIDLYKLHHFDRSMTSLKQVGFNLKSCTLTGLRYKQDSELTKDDMEICRKYIINNVLIIHSLYIYSDNLLKLRVQTYKDYNIVGHNMSNTSVARNYFIKTYSEESKIDKNRVKSQHTERESVSFNDVISDKIKFNTERYQNLLNELKRSRSNLVTDKINIRFDCNTIKSLVSKGGLHSINDSSYWESNDEYTILDVDWKSFYPGVILLLELHPEHLIKEIFLKIVKRLTEDRITAKNNGDTLKADNFKIKIISIFGDLGAEGSPTKDLKTFYSVTINGELLLLMLSEYLESTPNLQILMQNTDGLLIKYPTIIDKEIRNKLNDFKKIVDIPLDVVKIKYMFMENISSYLSVTDRGDIKRIGKFKKREDKLLSEDSSANIIAIALEEYFVNNISVESTILQHKDIFDFYMFAKKDKDQLFIYYQLIDGISNKTKYEDKLIRFYVSKNNETISKLNSSKKEEQLIPTGSLTLAQEHVDKEIGKYNIDYKWYINEANKIIKKIEVKTDSLF